MIINYKNYNINNIIISTYVTYFSKNYENEVTPVITEDRASYKISTSQKYSDSYPLFLDKNTSITIPKGIKRRIEKLPKKVLNKVDENKNIAIEKCLIVASNLTPTIYSKENDGYKCLSSSILHEQTKKGRDNTFIYKQVIEALKYSTNNTSPIIECKVGNDGCSETYKNNTYSKQYRFNPSILNKNTIKYTLKDPDCISKRTKHIDNKFNEANNNPIGKNLISVYHMITPPTEDEIIEEAKRLVKGKYTTKKGKLLTFLNKKKKEHYSDYENRSFVEEHIKKYNSLVSNGYMIPKIGGSKCGGRVYDSFNLIPSWMRGLHKIDNESIVELDYSALHPNIALSIYKGKTKYLTHEDLAKSLGKDVKDVKIEHLSFFNKEPKDMRKSALYDYYNTHEPGMLNKLLDDKKSNGYKHTSKRLFTKEVEIMEEIIKELNSRWIFVLYVFDALLCKESDADVVRAIMNKIIKDHKVYTSVK